MLGRYANQAPSPSSASAAASLLSSSASSSWSPSSSVFLVCAFAGTFAGSGLDGFEAGRAKEWNSPDRASTSLTCSASSRCISSALGVWKPPQKFRMWSNYRKSMGNGWGHKLGPCGGSPWCSSP